jgi:hypothetical protein
MRLLVISLISLLSTSFLQAQITLYPNQIKTSPSQTTYNTARTEGDTIILNLPFFDDFSTYTGQPDTMLWEAEGGAYISPNQALRPPSVNVAIFDGVDFAGVPYDFDFPTAEGIADNLTSHFIDISEYEFEDQLYISFYWQAEAFGEIPDSTDYLRLQFKDELGNWKTQWEVNGLDAVKDTFKHHIRGVFDNQGFFHDKFQFRFQTEGRLSGAFDGWVVDYIYFDANRDPSFPDRLDIACSEIPESFIAPYNAMPFEHYLKKTEQYTPDSIYATVNNLHRFFNVFSYDCMLENATTGEELGLLEVDSLKTVRSDLVGGRERQFKLKAAPNVELIPLTFNDGSLRDSIALKYSFRLQTGDPFDDVPTNDTISRTTVLNDYYAYDDGTGEFAAGVNQQYGKLAYRYFITEATIISDIDIYFPQIINDLTGQTFNLFIWKKLDFAEVDPVDNVLYQQEVSFEYTDELNKFRRIALKRPLEVSDTIFIGWEQLSDDVLAVGYDQNTHSGENMFFNVENRWEQNVLLDGSLMLRPVFRRGIVEGIEDDFDDIHEEFVLYPNPAKNIFYIKGKAKQIFVYDLQGKLLVEKSFSNEQSQSTESKSVSIQNLSKGLYLVRVLGENFAKTQKLVIF